MCTFILNDPVLNMANFDSATPKTDKNILAITSKRCYRMPSHHPYFDRLVRLYLAKDRYSKKHTNTNVRFW